MRYLSNTFFLLAVVCIFCAGLSFAGEDKANIADFEKSLRHGLVVEVEKALAGDAALLSERFAGGLTPLHISCKLENQQLVDFFIGKGADVTAEDDKGLTPLHYAAQSYNVGIAKSLLLDQDTDVNAVDRSGKTPLDYATKEVVPLLTMKGGLGGEEIMTGMDLWLKSYLPQSLHVLIDKGIFGIKFWRMAAALLIVIVALVINTVIRYFIKKKANKEDAKEAGGVRSFFGLLLNSLMLPARMVVWAGVIRLLGPVLVPQYTSKTVWLTEIMLSVSLAVFIYNFVEVLEYYLYKYAEKTENKVDDMLVPVLRKALRTVVVIVAGLHIYQSVTKQSITTILAGLGLGGLAFALAAQDTLKNLFGFVMIALDRPFTVGERINFDGHDGVIEMVGMRSTRMRTLDGHVVTIPNSKAADSVVHNIGRRPYIKRVMNIAITYDTPVIKIEKAVEIVRNILKDHEGMDAEFPPRVYFNDLKGDCLNILAIYWYFPPDYWPFLEHAQKVNLELMRRYEEEGIEFAFPTQTLYLAGDPNRDLVLRHEGLDALGSAVNK